MSPDRKTEAREAFDLLAPWRAVDRLEGPDAALFESLLKEDPELAARLDFALEERDANVALNEALPTPSTRARDDLFARIEAHERARSPFKGVGRWLSERLSLMSPGALAWSATAAALVIAVQGGLLTKAYLGDGDEAKYTTASDGHDVAVAGQTALVAFAPTATAGDIAKLLKEANAEIVGGPKPGGVFLVRLADKPLGQQELDAALKRLRDQTAVVKFATPSQAAPAQ